MNKRIIYGSGSLFTLLIAGLFLINTGETIAYPVMLDPHIVNFTEGLTPNEIQVNWQATVQLSQEKSELLSQSFLIPVIATDKEIEEMFIRQVEITFDSKYPQVQNPVNVQEKISELENNFKDKKTLTKIIEVKEARAIEESLSTVEMVK